MNELKHLQQEHSQVKSRFRITAAVAAFVLVVGSIFYHVVEKLDWLDSLYFCVITLATVGYGDITPKTDPGKVFTIFYVLVGIGIIATFANLLLKNSALRREIRLHKAKNTTR